ncbi:Mov34/MPN/PAD-1 family protein [Thiohalobacter thiocyanaticus]
MVLFEKSVVQSINEWKQVGNSQEAGGVLIGYKRPPHVHIVACTFPYSHDLRSRHRFFRRDPRHAQTAFEYWNRTSGLAYYVGDWHTHPVDVPTPSQFDKREWNKLYSEQKTPEAVFLIVGRVEWYVQWGHTRLISRHKST